MDDQHATFAKFLALNCVRNTFIEDLHAGVTPSSVTGDYSDVKVVSPYGEIPWAELSRISDVEMRAINKEVVNKLYTVLVFMDERGFLPINPFMMPSGWDAPEIDEDLYEGLTLAAARS